LDSLKIMQGVGNSAIANPNLSPPSLPHLVDLLNLPTLANLLTQNATKALSSEVFSTQSPSKNPPLKASQKPNVYHNLIGQKYVIPLMTPHATLISTMSYIPNLWQTNNCGYKESYKDGLLSFFAIITALSICTRRLVYAERDSIIT